MAESSAFEGLSLTTSASWDRHWRTVRLPQVPRWFNPNVFFTRRMLARGIRSDTVSLFEVGCAPGGWLACFARATGLDVSGCDVSPRGVHLAQENLRLLKVPNTVYQGDIFELALRPPRQFGLVYSIGVVEHFQDLPGILAAHAGMCRSGGSVIVTAPNLTGLSGRIFKRASPRLMESHRVVTPTHLERAACQVGLETIASGFGGPLCPFVLVDRLEGRVKRVIAYGLALVASALTYFGPGRHLSGSVYLIARKPTHA